MRRRIFLMLLVVFPLMNLGLLPPARGEEAASSWVSELANNILVAFNRLPANQLVLKYRWQEEAEAHRKRSTEEGSTLLGTVLTSEDTAVVIEGLSAMTERFIEHDNAYGRSDQLFVTPSYNQAVLRHLTSSNPRVLHHALLAASLGRSERSGRGRVDQRLEQVFRTHPAEGARYLAARAMAWREDLFELGLADRSAAVRYVATGSYLAFDKAPSTRILKLTNDENPAVCSLALLELARRTRSKDGFDRDEVISMARNWLKSDVPSLRAAALDALGYSGGGPEVLGLIAGYLDDQAAEAPSLTYTTLLGTREDVFQRYRKRTVRLAALWALQKVSQEGPGPEHFQTGRWFDDQDPKQVNDQVKRAKEWYTRYQETAANSPSGR